MNDEIAARLAAIRAREQAATPDPWYQDTYADEFGEGHGTSDVVDWDGHELHSCHTECDAAFIAHSRADVPYLLNVAEAAAAFLAVWVASATGGDVDTCDAAAALIEAFKA